MRLGCMMVGGAIACFLFGYKGLSDNIKFRQPITITAKEFIKKSPKEGWYKITDGEMLVTEAKYAVSSENSDVSKATKIFIPVHAKGDIDSKTTLVLNTEDPSIKATLVEIGQMDQSNDEAKAEKWLEANKERVLVHKTVQGMVAAGIDEDSSDKTKLANLGEELGPDFVVLNEGTEPPAAYKSIGLFVLGLILLPLSLFGFGFRRQNK